MKKNSAREGRRGTLDGGLTDMHSDTRRGLARLQSSDWDNSFSESNGKSFSADELKSRLSTMSVTPTFITVKYGGE